MRRRGTENAFSLVKGCEVCRIANSPFLAWEFKLCVVSATFVLVLCPFRPKPFQSLKHRYAFSTLTLLTDHPLPSTPCFGKSQPTSGLPTSHSVLADSRFCRNMTWPREIERELRIVTLVHSLLTFRPYGRELSQCSGMYLMGCLFLSAFCLPVVN